jgi:hypothetical protein
MTQKEMQTLEKVFAELRELTHKVQNIEDAILGSDYFGEGIKAKTYKNAREIKEINNKFKYIYYTLFGFAIASGYSFVELLKKLFP